MIVDITEAELTSLTQSILTRYGIDFTCYEPKSLRRRIIRLMNMLEIKSVHELWVKFLRDSKFIQHFMNEISVGMTSMFRDPILWKHLRERIQSEFSAKRKISVWHAGCSTGEEVYSFGILLKELKLLSKTTALATDFNSAAMEEAKLGLYHKIKMIENESNYRQYGTGAFTDYYTTDGKHAQMSTELIAHAEFKYHNLITDTYPTGFDIIFCRNVMIYFDTIAKNRILSRFHDSLNPGGYLIIGFFDTMSHLMQGNRFEVADEPAKIFRKI